MEIGVMENLQVFFFFFINQKITFERIDDEN